MIAFLIYLSVMGNAAAVAALALYLDPKLDDLISQTLFGIGVVPLTLGLCGIEVFVTEARNDYRSRCLERSRKRHREDPTGIALREELAAQEERNYQACLARMQKAETEQQKKLEEQRKKDEWFWAAVAARDATPMTAYRNVITLET